MSDIKQIAFIEKCSKLCLRENAIVIIVTNGGDADVAYRIARCLQQRYEKITAVISGQCKSAGTLLAIGAHELAFCIHGSAVEIRRGVCGLCAQHQGAQRW